MVNNQENQMAFTANIAQIDAKICNKKSNIAAKELRSIIFSISYCQKKLR